jgi:hypothetical protein
MSVNDDVKTRVEKDASLKKIVAPPVFKKGMEGQGN